MAMSYYPSKIKCHHIYEYPALNCSAFEYIKMWKLKQKLIVKLIESNEDKT